MSPLRSSAVAAAGAPRLLTWLLAAAITAAVVAAAVAAAAPDTAGVSAAATAADLAATSRKATPDMAAAAMPQFVSPDEYLDVGPALNDAEESDDDWEEEQPVAAADGEFDVGRGRLERRADAGTGGGGLCRLARGRLSRAELRRLLGNLLKDHHVFHAAGGGKRKRVDGGGSAGGGGRLCRYGKRGMRRPCGLYYKRLQGRPYAYHWPIMNILGGALG